MERQTPEYGRESSVGGSPPTLEGSPPAKRRSGVGKLLPLLTLAVGACSLVAAGQEARWTGSFSLLNNRMPEFSVIDTTGKVATSRSITGRATVLFVFCSCDACRQVAKEWARKQHEPFFHRVPQGVAATLVVYAGERSEAEEFAQSIDFDRKSTTVAYDPDETVAERYRAMPCPAVYLVDTAGFVRYSSKELAPPNEESPSVLIGQTLNMLTSLGGPDQPTAIDASPIAAIRDAGPRLTPVKEAGLEVIEDNGLLWQVDDVQTTSVTREFSFRNDGKVPIEIQQVQASCGCGAVKLSKNGQQVPSTVANPGETVKISVTTELGNGPISKVVSVWLYSKSLTSIGFVKISISKAK